MTGPPGRHTALTDSLATLQPPQHVRRRPAIVFCPDARVSPLPHARSGLEGARFTSAIGGRLKIRGVTCRPCNVECGGTIDASLNKSFAVICLMLAIESDRGQPNSLLLIDKGGRKVVIDPGFVPRDGGAPSVTVDGESVHIRAANPRQLQEVIAALERKHGKKVRIDAASHSYDFASPIQLKIHFESELFLRSVIKTALVFAEARAPELTDVLRPAWDYVAGRGAVDTVFDVQFTAETCPWSPPELGPIPHRLLVDADCERGEPTLRLGARPSLDEGWKIGHRPSIRDRWRSGRRGRWGERPWAR